MFSEGNIGAIEGTELLQALGLDALDIQKPHVFAKYLNIASYLGKFSDGASIARLVSKNSGQVDKLDKVHEYVTLRVKLDSIRAQIKDFPVEGTISSEDPEHIELKNYEQHLINEIKLYE